MKIISRKEAIKKGLNHYFTGRPCRRNHISKRRVNGAHCCECSYLIEKRWRKKNIKWFRKYQRNYYNINQDKMKIRISIWKTKSPRKALATNRYKCLSLCPTKNPVTIDDLLLMFKKQKGCCKISGIKMTWPNGTQGNRRAPTSISIDKINPQKTYTRDNVQLVCWAINAFKGEMSNKNTIKMLLETANFIRSRQLS